MALSVEDQEKVRAALLSALSNILRKHKGVTAGELRMLLNEAVQELERKGLIKRGERAR